MKRGLAGAAVTGVTRDPPPPQHPDGRGWATEALDGLEAHWIEGYASFPLLVPRQVIDIALEQGCIVPMDRQQLEVEFDLTGNVYRYRWVSR